MVTLHYIIIIIVLIIITFHYHGYSIDYKPIIQLFQNPDGLIFAIITHYIYILLIIPLLSHYYYRYIHDICSIPQRPIGFRALSPSSAVAFMVPRTP